MIIELMRELLQELRTGAVQLRADLAKDKAAVQTMIESATQQLAAIQTQLAAGNPPLPEDLNALMVSVTEIGAAVRDIGASATPPTE
jgi:hypothetical protein